MDAFCDNFFEGRCTATSRQNITVVSGCKKNDVTVWKDGILTRGVYTTFRSSKGSMATRTFSADFRRGKESRDQGRPGRCHPATQAATRGTSGPRHSPFAPAILPFLSSGNPGCGIRQTFNIDWDRDRDGEPPKASRAIRASGSARLDGRRHRRKPDPNRRSDGASPEALRLLFMVAPLPGAGGTGNQSIRWECSERSQDWSQDSICHALTDPESTTNPPVSAMTLVFEQIRCGGDRNLAICDQAARQAVLVDPPSRPRC